MRCFLGLAVTAGVALAASCVDDDVAIWKKDGRANFDDYMNKCGKSCMGVASCMQPCIKKTESYTDNCLSCFGTLGECTRNKCMMKCINGETPACKQCTQQYCVPAFETCSGFTDVPQFALRADDAKCTAADTDVWHNGGSSKFDAFMDKCGHKCWGKASCVSACVDDEEPGFSLPCLNCFGSLAQCTRNKCLMKCMSGKTAACVQCNKQYCVPDFKTCTSWDDIPQVEQEEAFMQRQVFV